MERRDFIKAAGIGIGGVMFSGGRALADTQAKNKPNLLIIHTDEHNFRTLGCYRETLPPEQAFMWGPKAIVKTPHIDSIAKNGVLCTSFYASSPVCSPSRASFVSGLYPHNTGTPGNDFPMKDSVVTFAKVLADNGYATGYAGKWHLDGSGKPQWRPKRNFGFADNRYMFNRGHWKQLEITDDGPRVKSRSKAGKPNYGVAGADKTSFTTDFLADRTIEFIKANKDKPFCYMVSIPDPHGPDTVRKPYDRQFAGMKFATPRTFGKTEKQTPRWARKEKRCSLNHSKYFGMVKCIDDNVGRILEALRTNGLDRKTIVVFTADHGDLRAEHHRHNKGVPYEASAKIPFVISWPGRLKPGSTISAALATVDFAPTILSLMNCNAPAATEGRDASALLLSGKPPTEWTDIVFLRQAVGKQKKTKGGWVCAVTDRHKLVLSPNDVPWLYDLEKDPDELDNRVKDPEYRTIAKRLATALQDYGKTHQDPYLRDAGMQADIDRLLQ